MRPDLVIYILNSARKQKNAALKDLRDINRIVEKISEKENKVIFIGPLKDVEKTKKAPF